jgi:3'(2'), 5'-bisphosphate nucleotidase
LSNKKGSPHQFCELPWVEKPDYRENIWDHAAGAIAVEEAGGYVTNMNGKPLISLSAQLIENRDVIASSGNLHEAVLASMAKQMP